MSEFQISSVWRNRREMRRNPRGELAGAIQDAIAEKGGGGRREKRGRDEVEIRSPSRWGERGPVAALEGGYFRALPVSCCCVPSCSHVPSRGARESNWEHGVVEGRWYLIRASLHAAVFR